MRLLPGRTEAAAKNHFNSALRQVLRQGQGRGRAGKQPSELRDYIQVLLVRLKGFGGFVRVCFRIWLCWLGGWWAVGGAGRQVGRLIFFACCGVPLLRQ